MFKLVKNLAVWWPVSVLEPDNDNPGSLREFTFEAEFVIRCKDDLKSYNDARDALLQQLPSADDYAADYKAASLKAAEIGTQIEAHDQSMFHLMVTDWRGVVGADDQVLPFSADNLDMALGLDRVRLGFNRAYDEAISQDKARLGNSKA